MVQAEVFLVVIGWRQYGPLQRRYPTKTPQGVTTHKTSNSIFTAMKIKILAKIMVYGCYPSR
jgi:hypothetical protein